MKKIFKKFILIDLALYALCFIAIFIESEEVAYMNEQLGLGFSDTYMIVAGIIAVIILLAHLVNLFLLYKFKNIGKAMYLVLFVITSLTYIAQGSFVYGPYDSLFGSLSWAVSGAILVFLYFTPIKYEFERGY